MKVEDKTKYAPELFIPEEEMEFVLNSEEEVKERKIGVMQMLRS